MRRLWYVSLLALVVAFVAPPRAQAQAPFDIRVASSFTVGDGTAEITAFDPGSARLFYVNPDTDALGVLDLSDPTNPTELSSIDLSEFGSPNSVDVAGGLVAVAIEADDPEANGSVVFFNRDGVFIDQVTVGVLPDAIAFNGNGRVLVVANEAEPAYGDDLDMDGDDDFLSDPEGSISIVEITPGDPPSFEVTTLGFTDFNAGGPRDAELPDGVRIFGDYDGDGIPSTVAQDLEPEYVTVTANGQVAYVTLQENNAIAVVNLVDKRIDSILALGTKDHSLAGNGIDASNRDDAINIQTWPVLGFYQPDAVETFRAGGQTYLITANEGDARDYDTYSEEERIGDFVLDPTAFPDAATLQLDENLGRLRTTSANGDIDGDGDYDVLYSYGARSFTIWTADGTLVFDSGDALEQITAVEIPAYFNSNNGLAEDFDERSDDKGPEPEGVVVGQINGRLYAFVGLERTSAIAVYDITDPTAPEYVSLLQNESDTPGELADVAPEGLAFISRLASPTGNPLLVVTNEVSGTVTTWEIDAPFALTVLHNNDGESQLLGVNTDDDADLEYGGIAHFATVVDQARLEARQTTSGSVLLTSGDNFLPGPEFNASLDDGVYYDALALDRIGYDAFDLGNHDFDFGPDVLAEFISAFPRSNAPFLSANLDFSGEANLQALVDAGRIAPSTVLRVDGERIGVIGLSPPNLRSISSPGGVVIDPNTVAVTQAQIDALEAQGINKIILISHLQSIEEELALIPQLSGIDIVIAGGGDELLINEDDLLVPGDDFGDRFGAYPLIAQNSDGADVPVVTTTGNYRYLGRLVVEFDADGTLTEVSDASGPIRVAQPASGEMDAVAANPAIQAEVVDPVAASVASLQANVIATTDVPLNGVRGDIRTQETNLGNLIADAFLWQANLLNGEFGVPAADVAFANGGGIRNDGVILPGNITEFDTFDILPFSNFITIVEDIEPAQLKEILENAVSRVEFVSGRFAQVAGLTFTYDPNGTARDTDDDGNVTTPGTRVRSVTLADGTAIVRDGEVVDGAPTINVATVDFLARGGDDYPYGDDTFTLLGVSYQQALANYLDTELDGTVSEADYPEIGEGRVVDLSAPFTLTILHNNDGESQLLGIDTDDDPDFEFGGIAHFATKVDELRAEAATMTNGSVLLTSGDNFLQGPEFNASLDDEVYYDAIGLDLIGYDGFAIGNHDFDFGPDVLAEFIGAFTVTQPPFVSANLNFTAEANLQALVDAERIVPSTILNVGGQQVGVLGLTTPNLPFIASPGDVVVSSDLATIAQAQIDALEATGVNKIILIAHLQGIEEDIDLIDDLRGVDVVIAGGGDELLANDGDLLIPGDEDEIFDTYPITAQDADGNDVPVVTTRGNYSYVGRLVVEFDGMGNLLSVGDESGPVRIAQPASGEADAVAADAAIQEQVVDPVAASVAALQANVIANSEVVLNGVRGDIRSVETNLGNLIADAFLWQANELNDQFGAPAADVALANGGGIRNDSEIPAGELTEFDTFDILPFSNFITIVEELTPEQFENLLENAISRVEGGSGTGRFAQIAGFTYTYDADRQARTFDDDGNVIEEGDRVRSATLADGTAIIRLGEVVDGAPNINVATADFLARGGDQYPFGDNAFTLLGVSYQQALANYIVENLGGQITAAAYPEGGEGRIVDATGVSNEDDLADLPEVFALKGNYPNPFNPSTQVAFDLPTTAEVELVVYDLLGREVYAVADAEIAAGANRTLTVQGERLASGTYVYRLVATMGAEQQVATGKMTLVK